MSQVPNRRPGEPHRDDRYPIPPAQYAELTRAHAPVQPERRLLLALLSDAIVVFRAEGGAVRGPRRQAYEEARRRILSQDSAWPFSFVNVCEALDIASQPLRRALVESRHEVQQAARRRLLAGIAAPLARTG